VTPRILVKHSILEVIHDDNKVTEEMIDRYFHLTLHKGNRQAFIDRAVYGISEDDINSEEYAKIRENFHGETLIQWGRGDIWIEVEVALNLKKVFANSELIIYENAGHIPQEEIPFETAKDVKLFLH